MGTSPATPRCCKHVGFMVWVFPWNQPTESRTEMFNGSKNYIVNFKRRLLRLVFNIRGKQNSISDLGFFLIRIHHYCWWISPLLLGKMPNFYTFLLTSEIPIFEVQFLPGKVLQFLWQTFKNLGFLMVSPCFTNAAERTSLLGLSFPALRAGRLEPSRTSGGAFGEIHPFSHRIHGAGIYIYMDNGSYGKMVILGYMDPIDDNFPYMLTWLGYIDGIHVTIYGSTMDPSWVIAGKIHELSTGSWFQ